MPNTIATLKKVIPIAFVIGAGMETFMCFTGFYDIVTHKEAERRMEMKNQIDQNRTKAKKLDIRFKN